jgi:ABC-2 type transport system ATP-binding protein
MIEATGLCRRYGDVVAVQGMTFSVQEGEILGILGPNGAGKTTTLRMLTGFLPPTAGRVTLDGEDLFRNPRSAKVRSKLGYLPENVALYPEMRVEEYLTYRARLEGVGRSQVAGAVGESLQACLLEDVRRQLIGTLSKGYRQRVGLAAAILHRPQVLVLDEPTVGLDPKQIIAIRDLIRDLGRRCTLILSTHILPEVELLCRRVLIIDRGQLVDQGSPEELRRRWMAGREVHLRFESTVPEGAEAALARLPGVRSVRASSTAPEGLVVDCDDSADPRGDIFRLAVAQGWVLVELAEQHASLEDIFVRLTTHDGATAEMLPEEGA